MTFIDRVREIERVESLGREELAMKAQMKYTRLRNLMGGQGQPRLDDIEALASAFPEYSLWLVYGREIPEAGQISPMTKETMEDYKKTGGD